MAEKTRENSGRSWRLGLIGAGRFGRFCLDQLAGWNRVKATAVSDAAPQLAQMVADAYHLACSETPEALFARDDVDLVLISTPPHTHYELTLQALDAGKHVVCEKPLALTVAHCDDLLKAAGTAQRLLIVNHLLRYSALLETAKEIIRSRVLGEPRRVFFENYAEDEHLPDNHWFWDRTLSGGIFLEHAVHFFDLHHWWFGPGEVLAAHWETRRGTEAVDRAWCQTRLAQSVLGHQYHGFDQSARLDRADHRIVFDRGQVVVHGWVPLQLEVMGIVDEAQHAQLVELCGECSDTIETRYEGQEQHCQGRGQHYTVTERVSLQRELAGNVGLTGERGSVYGGMIRRLLDDQLRILEYSGHTPRLHAEDAREAVAVAVQATQLTEVG